MIQEILNSLIKDDIEETRKYVYEFVGNYYKDNTIGYFLTSMTTNSILDSIVIGCQALEHFKQEESKVEEKILKFSFITRWYYSKKLQEVQKNKIDFELGIEAARWMLIKFLIELKDKIENNKMEKTKKE